jgi:sirohydrochlorin cobaltochelatase
MRQGILLFAHGSPDPQWSEPFRDILARVRNAAPETRAELAFLDVEPGFDAGVDALAESGASHIQVVPLFLARGGHLRRDLPRLVAAARQRTGLPITTADCLGESEDMRNAMAVWALAQAAVQD